MSSRLRSNTGTTISERERESQAILYGTTPEFLRIFSLRDGRLETNVDASVA